MKLQNPS